MEADHMNRLYRSRNPLVRFVHVGRLRIIGRLLRNNRGRLLDCGCGEGHLLHELSGERYGIDCCRVALRQAKERSQETELLQGDITQLPFRSGSFDVAICSEVLEHISDCRTAISELMRVTRSGGRIVVTAPNERNWRIARLAMLRFPIKLKDHLNSFSPSELTEMFGLKPTRAVYFPINVFSFSLTQVYEFEKRDK